MIKPSLPQDRAALIDKDFRVTLPYRRWMSDVTNRLVELGTTTGPIIAPPTALDLRITGKDPIKVIGNTANGFDVSLQAAALTASGDIDGGNFTDTYTSMDGAIDGGAGFA